jgi:hypothetical protein
MMIYRALFAHDEPIEIKRRPIRLWCEVDRLWFLVDASSTWDTMRPHRAHPDCSLHISDVFETDLYFSPSVQTQSRHFPCPKSLADCDLSLNLLLACRKIYWEARILPYAENTFLAKQLSAFSNFTYCLKSWQAHSISHLAFDIPETHGMTTHLAEWNDTFSLIAASFFGLRTISVKVQLHDPLSACWSSFWDGGLLELDRLQLKGLEFIVLDGDMQPYFTYSAGIAPKSGYLYSSHNGLGSPSTEKESKSDSAASQSDPVSFHRCRDRFRQAHQYDRNDDADQRIFFRFSPNPCPLYVRNLIHLLPRRKRTHADIRRQDGLQRELPYRYAFTDGVYPIFGYQFSDPNIEQEEIVRNIKKLRLSRQRLANKLRSPQSNIDLPRQLGGRKADRTEAGHPKDEHENFRHVPRVIVIDGEPRGQWRRRLNEETFAPFFESFPPQNPASRDYPRSKYFCTECDCLIGDPRCFLHA